MKNTGLTEKEFDQFNELFSKWCEGEINAWRCSGECDSCPINESYNMIFGPLTLKALEGNK